MTQTNQPNKVRADFERWHNRFDQQERLKPLTSGLYRHTGTQAQWDAWQASRTAALNEAIELFNARGLQQLLNPSPQDIIKELRDGK